MAIELERSRTEGLHHIGPTVSRFVSEIKGRSTAFVSAQDASEVKRALNGNGHSRGKPAEQGFSSIIADKPLFEEERISDGDLFASLHLLKTVYRLNHIPTSIRREAFRGIKEKAGEGLIGKGFKGYIEALADSCQRAPFSK